jgi:hypothetical protein
VEKFFPMSHPEPESELSAAFGKAKSISSSRSQSTEMLHKSD